ncbi:MFS transporter [Saccharomonospora sp. CUA-673]|nr:MFS transporter [Saccharomonospora sp. CUA-673]
MTLSGVLTVGISFGFARYGYGLFLPEMRAEFGLSTTVIGVLGSATYVGYLVALLLVGTLASRVGPRLPVVVGGLSATIGMALVAAAENEIMLVAGLVLAGTSPGWIWAPYSDAVTLALPPRRRETVLAAVPSGTAFGVAVAGPLAIVFHGAGWQRAWWIFAVVAFLATVHAAVTVPRGATPTALNSERVGVRSLAGRLLPRHAAPLYLTAVSYGLVGSVYWLFAVERITGEGPSGAAVAPLFWTLTGVAGCAALGTGAAFARLGLPWAHRLIFGSLATATVLLAVVPGSLVAVVGSAVLYGPAFMAGSALLAVWSYQVFPARPTAGFSATVFFLGIGTIAGPALAGVVADRTGLGATLALTALLGLVTIAWAPRGNPAGDQSGGCRRSGPV